MATFNFCPNGLVPVTIPREIQSGMSLNGWHFASKPTTPHQRKFRVKLFGLRWYILDGGGYDLVTNPSINAALLEKFYADHELHTPFDWTHPNRGPLVVRFAAPLTVPEAAPNSGGLLEPLEVTFVHHNPGFDL